MVPCKASLETEHNVSLYKIILVLSFRKSIKVVEKYFEQYALVGQDILENKQNWDKVLALVPEDILFFFDHSFIVRCVLM